MKGFLKFVLAIVGLASLAVAAFVAFNVWMFGDDVDLMDFFE